MIKFIKSLFSRSELKKYKEASWLPESYYREHLNAFCKELHLSNLEFVSSTLANSLKLAEEAWCEGYGGIDLEHGNRLDTLYKIKHEYLKELSSNWWNEYYKDTINSALKTLGSDKECHVYKKPEVFIAELDLGNIILDNGQDSRVQFNFRGIGVILENIAKAEAFLKLTQRVLWDNLNKYVIEHREIVFDIDYAKYCVLSFQNVIEHHKMNVYYILSVGTVDLGTVKLYEDYIKKLEKIVEAIGQAIKYKEDNFHCIIKIGE